MRREIIHNRHSEEAMRLAKSMRRSRQKQKTSQVICHHLRMMLAEESLQDSLQGARPLPAHAARPVSTTDDHQIALGF